MIRGVDVQKEYATGSYTVQPYTYDKTKWGVYSPNGVCLEICDSQKQANIEAGKWRTKKEGGDDL